MDTLNPHQSEYLIRKVVCNSIIEWVCVVCCVTILTMNDYCCKLSNTKPKLPCFRKANGHHAALTFLECTTVPWKQEICSVYPLTWLARLGCNQDTGFSLERLETCYKWAACGEKLISHINQFDCNSAFDVGQEFLVLMSRTMPSPLTSNGLSALIFWAHMVFVWHAP